MAQILTVEEALASMQAKKNKKGDIIINRFNKRNFNTLMLALANDIDFASEFARIKNGDVDLEEVMVTKKFRKWCKRLVEKMGIDKSESERIMTSEFTIDNIDGIYEFFTEAVYLYMKAGNRFDLPSKKGFQGGIYLKDIPEKETVSESKNPQTGESLGKYKRKKKAHTELKSRSTTPGYLTEKYKI